jgi:chromate transport protein ChrA
VDDSTRPTGDSRRSLGELAKLSLRLGLTAFGGPAAHIAMMEEEVVRRRGWLSRERFLDLLGATNLIPGPTSTEMVIHLGLERAGVPGLWLAGVCFIAPAALITLAIAWAYVQYGSLPAGQALLFGVKPAVLAILVLAVGKLARAAAKSAALVLLGVFVLALYLLGASEVALLLGSGAVGLLLAIRRPPAKAASFAALAVLLPAATAAAAASGAAAPSAFGVGLYFSSSAVSSSAAATCSSPSSSKGSWRSIAGSRASNCSTPSPSASSPPALSFAPPPSSATSSPASPEPWPRPWGSSCPRSSSSG